MKLSELFLVILTFLSIQGYGQTFFQALDAENAYFENEPIKQFQGFKAGDTLVVEKNGYVALVSNFYHAVELLNDTTWVVPHIDQHKYLSTMKAPILKQFLEENKLALDQPVEHALQYMEIYWPPKKWVLDASEEFPIFWELHGLKEGLVSTKIQFTSLFGEVIFTIQDYEKDEPITFSDSLKTAFEKEKELFMEVSATAFEKEFSEKVLLSITENKIGIANAADVDNAVEAVALAFFFERNCPELEHRTRELYKQALRFSDREIYRQLYQAFEERNN
ncbi:hypothetical protein [Fulvivirga lutea]|uniref:Uncharacterized protein n=1 Tax=Fulvivirga lutea TaxID=2810512 RepID=A0A975A149_9BACT|nr:hypothetical protein [Fulvivirga lutea]QSE98064.1 hypothetical protein JR347_02995 [Fulvivirga lutea]